jgi:hypothetical protein
MGASRNARMFGRKPQTAREREGANSMRAPTSTGCADGRVQTGERGWQGICLTGAVVRTRSEIIVRVWSGERGVGILRVGSGNYCQNFINIGIPLKIEILMADVFKNSIFGKNWDLLPWIQKTFQPS